MTQNLDNTGSSGSTLRRKVSLGKEQRATHTMSLARALRLSLAKLADEQFDLALSVLGVDERSLEHDALMDRLEDACLLMVLEGADRARAMIAIDPTLVGALIQQQTMGKVIAGSDDPRPMTQTDGALCGPFVNDVLARAAAYLAQTEELCLIAGFGGATRVESLRLLGLALEAAEFHLVEIDLDLAGGGCQGKISLALPLGKATSVENALEATAPMAQNRASLSDAIAPLPLELNVCLSQLRISYQELAELEVGQSLPIGKSGLELCHLQTTTGKTLMDGCVGQIAGERAFQIRSANSATINSLETAEPATRPAATEHAEEPELEGPQRATNNAQTDLPELAQAPDLPDIADMPDMSDLPELDDLPDLEDLATQKVG